MSLNSGTSLGPYEITALIGAGGMGEVYRARDRRLDRIVAIKVLPAALSARPDLRQRLEREARTVSSLNHQHICTLYDVGETADGSAFLVMEYLEGESLAERLARGPMPVRQAIRFGAEIADALDRAHRQGIVHRDLKPGNVMITKSGVKLLDFGLAKLISGDIGLISDPNSPTVQQEKDVTAEGTIVGTLQYMAPEQLEGRVADARSDIFALGATLYEMLTGQRAFVAGSRAALIASILHSEPAPIASVAPAVPPQVARLVEHCLGKEPDDRWQTARDVAIQLRGMLEGSGSAETIAVPPHDRRRLLLRGGAALALALVGATAATLWQRGRGDGNGQQSRFTHTSLLLSADRRLSMAPGAMIAVSPDGTKLAFIGQEGDDPPRIYVRRLDSFDVAPIAGSEDAVNCFFSPDSNEIGFASQGKLRRVSILGGAPETLADAGPAPGGSWGSDGMIVFNPTPGAALHRVPAAGGRPELLMKSLPANDSQPLPVYLPELGLLFHVREVDGKPYDEAEIVAISLETGERRVVAHGTAPKFVAKKSLLVFARGGKLWSVPFDVEKLRVRGMPVSVAEPVLIDPGDGQTVYDVTANGEIVYAPYDAARLRKRLMLVDRSGAAVPMPFPPGLYESPRLSGDGRMLMVEIMGANNDVWLGDMGRGTMSRLTSSWENLAPILSPDGKSVVVSRHHGSIPGLYLVRTDGAGEPRRLAPSEQPQFAFSWSGDGTIAFVDSSQGNTNIELLRTDRPDEVVPFLQSRFNETSPALSPDGRWIAYVSDETGVNEVYVRSTGAEGAKVRISTEGGREPLWSHSGRELFYRREDALMAVQVTMSPELTASAPVRLFSFPSSVRDITRSYDITPDDRRFVMIERAAAASSMDAVNVVIGALDRN